MTEPAWWQSFFDADYLSLWGAMASPAQTAAQVEALWSLLDLREGTRVLDAPCGYGRLSRPIAERGAIVMGVDQSAELIAEAERTRGALPAERLRYLRHDLRQPLAAPEATGFDVAFNVFSSIGYGTDADDLAILQTLHDALRPGGRLLLDTMHRDPLVASISRGHRPAYVLGDGTLVVEEQRFDPIAGRIETTWHHAGPGGHGHKTASLRIYSATELVALCARAGLRLVSAHAGISERPFRFEGPDAGGRLALLLER